MTTYRCGRHNSRIVYRQRGPEPSNDDEMVAAFFNAVAAKVAVEALNAATAGEPVSVPPPVDALLDLADELARLVGLVALGQSDKARRAGAERRRLDTAARALWSAGVEEGRREDERALMQALMERDDYEEIADKLTSAVGRHLGVDMGEHSNANSPWENALNALDEADGGKFVKGTYDAGVEEGRRQLDEATKVAAAHAYELGVAEGRRQAEQERTENLTTALDEVLRCFYEKGHPGFSAVRSCWVREDKVAGWRLVLDEARSHG